VECENRSYTGNKRASGIISRSFREYLNNIAGQHEIKELQKTVLLGTAHTHIGNSKCRRTKHLIDMGNTITCAINCNYRTAVILYALETCFVSGM